MPLVFVWGHASALALVPAVFTVVGKELVWRGR